MNLLEGSLYMDKKSSKLYILHKDELRQGGEGWYLRKTDTHKPVRTVIQDKKKTSDRLKKYFVKVVH